MPLYDTLIKHRKNEKFNNNFIIKDCAKLMEEKFSKYENGLRNKISLFATILDPRLNIKYFETSEAYELKTEFIEYLVILQ